MATINPYINFNGNAEEAFNFYKSVFGGEFSSIVRFKDLESAEFPVSEEDANKIMRIVLPISGNTLIANDVPAALGTVNENENRSKISVSAQNRDEADSIMTGLSAGLTYKVKGPEYSIGEKHYIHEPTATLVPAGKSSLLSRRYKALIPVTISLVVVLGGVGTFAFASQGAGTTSQPTASEQKPTAKSASKTTSSTNTPTTTEQSASETTEPSVPQQQTAVPSTSSAKKTSSSTAATTKPVVTPSQSVITPTVDTPTTPATKDDTTTPDPTTIEQPAAETPPLVDPPILDPEVAS
ncbi:VOC family protein [Candidatus Saccharibacteria bacterium]|nr:VOC family protein [Candidatus Saccharibacteria bacterium]